LIFANENRAVFLILREEDQLPLYNYQPQQGFVGTNEARSLALISKVIV
jgi:hypothetical protein